MSRHAFDGKNGLIHVASESVVRGRQLCHGLRKEKEDYRYHGRRPEHDLVKLHHPRAVCRTVRQVEGQSKKCKRDHQEDRSIVRNKRRHPRTGDPAQDE